MRIATRFVLCICIIAVGYIATIVVSHVLSNRTQERLDYAARSLFPAVLESRRARTLFERQCEGYQQAVLFGEAWFAEDATESGNRVQYALTNLLSVENLPEALRDKASLLKESLKGWSTQADRVYTSLLQEGNDEDPAFVEITRVLDDQRLILNAQLSELVSGLTGHLTSEHDRIISLSRMQSNSNLILFFIVTIFSAIGVFILVRKIVGPIQTLAETAIRIKEGELGCKADVTSNDEIGELAEAFNSMTDNLSRAVTSLEDEVVERTHAEEEIRKLNVELQQSLTERTKAYQELEVAKKASDAAAEAKSNFLANMSHEIRTPMNPIIGMCDLMFTTDMTPKQRNYLEIIRSSSMSLLALINDILDFSKIDAGKLDLGATPFSPWEVIEEVAGMFQPDIRKKGIAFIVDIDPALPSTLLGDPLRLRQVLANLTSNALKFTDKGLISISVENRSTTTDRAHLLFSVHDTGIGIAENIRHSLFNAFEQADGTITRKYGGSGLGLAICRSIAKMMDGDIWMDSEPGQGSTFFFGARFEFASQEEQLEPPVPVQLANLSVLIVASDHGTSLIVQQILHSLKFKAEIVRSTDQARKAYDRSLDTQPFDMVILDSELIGEDVVALALEMKQNRLGPPPRFIVLAGTSREAHRARDQGQVESILKPIKRSELFGTIMRSFGHAFAQPKPAKAFDAEELAGKSLLLVEDNPINQAVAIEILETVGVSVDTAGNGFEALEAIKLKHYDAVLMDVQMPGMDGFTATKNLRLMEAGCNKQLEAESPDPDGEPPPPRRIPIIAMTANALKGDRERCLEAGMDDYISKPVATRELFATLTKWVT